MEEVTDGGGTKALRLTSNRILARAAPCRQHRQPAIMFAARLGGDALGDFRWNIRVRLAQSGGQLSAVSHLISSAVPTL